MDILFFAAIAIFIIFKLKSQLGQISDEEKERIAQKIKQKQEQILQMQSQVAKQAQSVAVVAVANDEKNKELIRNLSEENQKILQEIFQKCQISASFFLNGAKYAFEMVIKSFSGNKNEDLETLEFLLSQKIFDNFKLAIEERKKEEKSLNTEIISIERIEFVSASIQENQAFIVVKILSKQINYFTNKNGEVVDGSKEKINELQDVWTFKKDLAATDPNWKIYQT